MDGLLETKWAPVAACDRLHLLVRLKDGKTPNVAPPGDVVNASLAGLLLLAIADVVLSGAALVVVLAGRSQARLKNAARVMRLSVAVIEPCTEKIVLFYML